MKAIKQYESVNREDVSINFGISKMDLVYDKRKGEVDEPHRHNFYTVLVVKKGKGCHKIDFNTYELGDQQIYFIAPSQVHQLLEEEKTEGYAITFSTDFLVQHHISAHFINDLNLFRLFGESPPLEVGEEKFAELFKLMRELIELNEGASNYKDESIAAYLRLFLIQCHNSCSLQFDNNQEQEVGYTTFRKFKELLEQNFHQWHKVSEYATALNISPDYLNRLIKNTSGKSTKEMIQSRIITAAKRMLYFSSLSNKEVGYELGFQEPAAFSAFFKKCTGYSPQQFKKEQA